MAKQFWALQFLPLIVLAFIATTGRASHFAFPPQYICWSHQSINKVKVKINLKSGFFIFSCCFNCFSTEKAAIKYWYATSHGNISWVKNSTVESRGGTGCYINAFWILSGDVADAKHHISLHDQDNENKTKLEVTIKHEVRTTLHLVLGGEIRYMG